MVVGGLVNVMVFDLGVVVMRSVVGVVRLSSCFMMNRCHQTCLSEDIVDWCVRLCQNLSLREVFLQRFNIMRLTTVMMTHVLLESSS